MNRDEWLKARVKNVNSTESAALFNLSPYVTAFELWHKKKNATVEEIEPNERMRWGTRLQSAIALGIAEDKGLTIEPFDEYLEDTRFRMGSSFDFKVEPGGILEVKNVSGLSYKNDWLENEAPPHIEIQVMHQMAVSGRDFAYIGALIGGNELILIKRGRNEALIKRIKDAVSHFWDTIEKNTPPPVSFPRDSAFIRELYSNSKEGVEVEADESVITSAESYKTLSKEKASIDERLDEIKARILMFAGEAAKVRGPNFSISLGMVEGGPVSYIRKPYRNFKPYFKKEK